MIRTKICDVFNIRYPILQGGMAWVGTAELIAAVSNAGGLGIASALTERGLQGEIKKIKELTDKPFGLNVPLNSPIAKKTIEIAIKERIPIIATSAGDPNKYTRQLKDAGAKVMHVVASPVHAKKAEEAGVDAVVAEGVEKGGHISHDEIGIFVLLPQVVDAVKIPVIAAGGICDARGFVAALALGASGVQMGTGFITTKECIVHPICKDTILKAKSEDTTVIMRGAVPSRVLKNEFAKTLLTLDANTPKDVALFKEGMKAQQAFLKGDVVNGIVWCGEVAGMLNKVVSVQELIEGMVSGAHEIIAKLQKTEV